jgi:hypothetical protein
VRMLLFWVVTPCRLVGRYDLVHTCQYTRRYYPEEYHHMVPNSDTVAYRLYLASVSNSSVTNEYIFMPYTCITHLSNLDAEFQYLMHGK